MLDKYHLTQIMYSMSAEAQTSEEHTLLTQALDNLRQKTAFSFSGKQECVDYVGIYGTMSHEALDIHKTKLESGWPEITKSLFADIADGINQLRHALITSSQSDEMADLNLSRVGDYLLEELWAQESLRPLFNYANALHLDTDAKPTIADAEQFKIGKAAHHVCARIMYEMYDVITQTYAPNTEQRLLEDSIERLEEYSLVKLIEQTKNPRD